MSFDFHHLRKLSIGFKSVQGALLYITNFLHLHKIMYHHICFQVFLKYLKRWGGSYGKGKLIP